ncbi:hypothetical protein LXL04_000414 [Taraxacum kok-saghyz]
MPPKAEGPASRNNEPPPPPPPAPPTHQNPPMDDPLQALVHLNTANAYRLDSISHNLTQLIHLLAAQQPPPQPPPHQQPPHPPPQPPPPPPNNQPRPPKISLPNFDGSNPLDWLFQANNYFDYYAVAATQRAHSQYSPILPLFPKHIISATGVSAYPEKLAAIQNWPPPTSFTALRGFLGLTGYYRRFVRSYAQIAGPLTDILRHKKFLWNTQAQTALTQLKAAMSSLITLTLPNFDDPFDVTTDASNIAIGAVLSQHDKPIALYSKKMCPRMQSSSAYVRELYAITESVKKWRQYLLGRKFRIFTDQRSLKHLLTQVVQTPEQYKWATKLIGFDFEIFYKPGKENKVADALSRIEEAQLLALSTAQPAWITELRNFYQTDTGIKCKEHLPGNNNDNTFTFRDGLLYSSDKMFIPNNSSIRQQLLLEYHSSTLGGHSGVAATIRRLSSTFRWPKLKEEIRSFIRHCKVCQETKYPTHKPYGLLQPIPVPTQVWADIFMDFITYLPSSGGKTVIWVVVDRFSKFAHFIPLPTKFTAPTLAALFLQYIYRLHGLPKSIITDRDPLFLSGFWKEMFKRLGTRLHYSTAYHPQSDGQTEVVNRCLQSYLRAFASDEPHSWNKYLYLAEYWYNTSLHSAINMPPFQALYGRPIPDLNRYIPGQSDTPDIDLTLSEHNRIRTLLRDNLRLAQQRMSNLANSHRLDKEFNVGDMVLERIGKVAYRLKLPDESLIHSVFHVSLLRQAYGNPQPTPLPPFCMDQNHTSELEDELVLENGAVDTSPQSSPVSPTKKSPPEEQNRRPKRNPKIPARLLD